MFGTYRLALSILVLVTHLGSVEIFAGQAVWAFFMLSGFLITGVLNTRYGYTAAGLTEFALGRALRLMPTYWLSVAVALACMSLLTPVLDPQRINSAFGWPESAGQWFSALALLGQSIGGVGRIERAPSPSAWAVEVEVLLYLISCLWLSRNGRLAWRTAVACLMLFPVLWLAGKGLMRLGYPDIAGQLTYSFLPAALLPYALGACIWHQRERLSGLVATPMRLATAAAGIAVCALLVSRISVTAAYILSLPIMAFVTASLANHAGRPRARAIDDFLGHMSYPVYLLHWTCAYLFAAGFGQPSWTQAFHADGGHGLLQFTPTGFVLATLTTLAVAACVAWLFELPIERHRRALASRLTAGLRSREQRGNA